LNKDISKLLLNDEKNKLFSSKLCNNFKTSSSYKMMIRVSKIYKLYNNNMTMIIKFLFIIIIIVILKVTFKMKLIIRKKKGEKKKKIISREIFPTFIYNEKFLSFFIFIFLLKL
jgi:chromate transport protein ChrA